LENQNSKSIVLEEVINQLEKNNEHKLRQKLEKIIIIIMAVFCYYIGIQHNYLFDQALFLYLTILVGFLYWKHEQQQASIKLILKALKEVK
tara:strand:+ start:241 stop:513 length:273 start_codon:yes stop_codon:yes gene_type:complete